MVKAKISSSDLVLELEGWDRFWSFKREVIIKLKNIRSIRKANKKIQLFGYEYWVQLGQDLSRQGHITDLRGERSFGVRTTKIRESYLN